MTDRAIMQQALEALELLSKAQNETALDYADNAIDALRTRLAQPEQEPVAWEDVLGAIARGWAHDDNKHKTMDVQLAVAIAKEIQDMVIAPPHRKPLTDEEISDLWCKVSNTDFVTADTHEFARAIEAKLKERNT